jgi:hypothetical protein
MCATVILLLGAANLSKGQNSLFWAVTRPGHSDTSWLLGTLHMYPKRVVELPASVQDKLVQSKQLYIEIQADLKMIFQMLTTSSIGNELMPSEASTWTAESWDTVKQWFINRNYFDEATYDKVRLRSSEGKLTSLYLEAIGYEYGAIEEDLSSLARKGKIQVKGLDRDWSEIQTWYAHYAQLSDESWKGNNLDSLLEAGYYELAHLFVAYAIQDSAFLGDVAHEGVWRDGLTLVEWRNHNWMRQLQQLMQRNCFVAVGAAHLFGPHGVVSLLRQAGFVCTPLKVDFGGPRLKRFIIRNSRLYRLQPG